MATELAVAAGRGGSAPDRRRRPLTAPDRLSGALATAFLCASVVGAATRLISPYQHGWWLVAYLTLVGGFAQILLAPGGTWVARQLDATTRREQHRWWALALWNLGTVLVPVGVFSGRAMPVLAGSALLLASLALHGRAMRSATATVPRRSSGWKLAYYTVIAGLVGSVFTGAVLAGALPLPT